MTIPLTESQQSALLPLHQQAQETSGAVMLGIERLLGGELTLRATVISGDQKQAMISAMQKLKAKQEVKG